MAISYNNGSVTQDGWFVSRMLASGIPAGGRLSVSRGDYGHDKNGFPKWRRGDYDGREFASKEECDSFLRSHGYLQPYRPSVGAFKARHRASIKTLTCGMVAAVRQAPSRESIVEIANGHKESVRQLGCDVLDSLCFANGVYATARRLRPDLFREV